MSTLWVMAGLTQEQREALDKVDALPGDHGRREMASGEPVKALMAEHHIIVHKTNPFHHDIEPDHYGGTITHDADQDLHTSQQHVWKPALRRFIREGHEHLMNEELVNPETGESDTPYYPETMQVGDRHWIDEGHHRLLARRMLGEDVECHYSSSSQDDAGIDYDKEDG